ncbi:2-hydroxyacyl-CoA lyase 1-like protein [Gonapodya prolifera JEL478]|uniref:2-hydroxyacyl-CoA lyase n=1 Tax=Gonapodya prolifera (strain JEL478) TaxID=1344416 RepID=A0A139AZ95_GONPJ|nr:2-hydroxyacyl-CoA lyase 1-like protein [Gonapodya prolifera JEL478]|eukprot:KXS22039.1 2-hydroxyacyl-CoA lyase 1-like protein [Gonapodya prolifera JEL478]
MSLYYQNYKKAADALATGQDVTVDGAFIIARALAEQGIDTVFGIVGFPVIEIAEAMTANGIHYIGMRNEQAASYAAQAYGYLKGVPGCCLTVSGPGVIHALAGLSNAKENAWPIILIGGAQEARQEGMGGFQEYPQVEACRPYCKFSGRPPNLSRIPFFVEKAVRAAVYGRPGASYIDMPADTITDQINASKVEWRPHHPPLPVSLADPSAVAVAAKLLKAASRPLIIVGKGAGWARAEKETKALVESTGIPFLPTPMGKGVVDDTHPQNVIPARSDALKGADVVVLVGARFNWIMHFGTEPRYAKDLKVIQIDIEAEEMSNNVPAAAALLGHLPLVLDQLTTAAKQAGVRHSSDSAWWKQLRAKIEKNVKVSADLMADETLPMSYYRAFKEIKQNMPAKFFFVSEGSNTMDIARTIFDQVHPRTRLDAGTFGTMGVGSGFAIAGALARPDLRTVVVQGDSAFGFSGMEIETVARLKLPIIWIIINNNGIGVGVDGENYQVLAEKRILPSNALLPEVNYEKFAEAVGGKGYICHTPSEITSAMRDALQSDKLAIINVMISPSGSRKAQSFNWLERKAPETKI